MLSLTHIGLRKARRARHDQMNGTAIGSAKKAIDLAGFRSVKDDQSIILKVAPLEVLLVNVDGELLREQNGVIKMVRVRFVEKDNGLSTAEYVDEKVVEACSFA